LKTDKGMAKLRRDDAFKLTMALLSVFFFFFTAATSDIQDRILGVVFLALVIWSLYPKRHLESSIIIMVVLSLLQVSYSLDEFIGSLFSTYGGSGLWIIISGFILAKAMGTSGLARRIALWITTSLGANPEVIILSVALANLAIAPLSPSTTAKAFLLLPICTSLVDAYEVEKGQSNYGAAVMLMAMAANNICSTAFLTATVPNPISAGYIGESSSLNLDWINWLRMALPLTLILLAASWFICVRMFRPEVKKTHQSLEQIRELRVGLGPLTREEWTVALFFLAALILWITDGLHPYNAGLLSLVLSIALFIPGIGVMEVGGFTGEVPWGSIVLFAASMFLSKAVGRWRALDPVAELVFGVLNLSELETAPFVALVVLVSMLLHVAFTSTTVYATVMVPLAISLGQLVRLAPQLMALPVAFLTPVAVILPVNTIPNIIFHSSGHFSETQMIEYGLVVSVISVITVLLVGLPYWRLLGYF
jgi:sodium-dependent dicarboxylate transporter 2/3/5